MNLQERKGSGTKTSLLKSTSQSQSKLVSKTSTSSGTETESTSILSKSTKSDTKTRKSVVKGKGPEKRWLIIGIVGVGVFCISLFIILKVFVCDPSGGCWSTPEKEKYVPEDEEVVWKECGRRSVNPTFPPGIGFRAGKLNDRLSSDEGAWNETKSELDKEPLIIHALDAELYEYPWVARVYNASKNNETYCTASLLNQYFLLTAAHCFESKLPKGGLLKDVLDWETGELVPGRDLRIQIGGVNLSDPNSHHRKIVRAYVYKGYNYDTYFAWNNDIALIKIEEPGIPPPPSGKQRRWNTICPPKSDLSRTPTPLELAGWGIVLDPANNNQVLTKILQKAKYSYDGGELCSNTEHKFFAPRPRYFCLIFFFQTNGMPTPQFIGPGDSGGPFMYAPSEDTDAHPVELVATVSYHRILDVKIDDRVARCDVNPSVHYFWDTWIREKMETEWPQPD